jgi:hypothetical protein
MEASDYKPFVKVYQLLSVAMRRNPLNDEEGVGEEVYFQALSYLPFKAVNEAAQKISREGGEWFPTTAVWCRVADELAYKFLLTAEIAEGQHRLLKSPEQKSAMELAEIAKAQLVKDMRDRAQASPGHPFPWEYVAGFFERMPVRPAPTLGCDACGDSGFVRKMCEQESPCERHQMDPDFEPHEDMARCPCVSHNPVIKRRQELASLRRTKRVKE